ncbi:TM109 protein, partial [Turnix velox]|nr:TM109 protein [Turnix velox]
TAEDPLYRLGRATWVATESWLGPQPLRLVTESLAATFWLVASGISVALTTLSRILGDLLATTGLKGEFWGGCGKSPPICHLFPTWVTLFSLPGDRLLAALALSPTEVQRLLLWTLVAAVASWLLSCLRGLLLPLVRVAKLCFFLVVFCHVATCRENPTTQAGLLLGLWVLYTLLGGWGGGWWPGTPPSTSPQLEATVRSLEWKVEELRRRQR